MCQNCSKELAISDSLINFSYTLSSNAITIKHTGCNVDVVKIGFWVVEFV